MYFVALTMAQCHIYGIVGDKIIFHSSSKLLIGIYYNSRVHMTKHSRKSWSITLKSMLILKSVGYSSVGRATGRLEIRTSRSRFESQYGWSSCLHSILFCICCHNQSLKPLDQIRGKNFQNSQNGLIAGARNLSWQIFRRGIRFVCPIYLFT